MRSLLVRGALTSFLALAAMQPAGAPPWRPAAGPPGEPARSNAAQIKENPKDGLKYVWIPGGTFRMGCSEGDQECFDEEKPAHRVAITHGFWLGQTEVTVAAYQRYSRARGKSMPGSPHLLGFALNKDWSDGAMPMVTVSWEDAHDYCGWTGGRLPTEAEWEYAARGGTAGARYGPLDEIAWDADNSGREHLDSARGTTEDANNYPRRFLENGNSMHEVAHKRPNAFRLYDTLGNAWEWVNDWYDGEYYKSSPAADPQGPAGGDYRVMRGGSWLDPPWDARVSFRGSSRPDMGFSHHGFRCALETPAR